MKQPKRRVLQRRKRAPEKKTSLEWQMEIKDDVVIMDHEGWDREDFDFSFRKEKITKEEFLRRRDNSTTRRVFEKLRGEG